MTDAVPATCTGYVTERDYASFDVKGSGVT